jgi:hypothetical protein
MAKSGAVAATGIGRPWQAREPRPPSRQPEPTASPLKGILAFQASYSALEFRMPKPLKKKHGRDRAHRYRIIAEPL